jgi:hypothetical protein
LSTEATAAPETTELQKFLVVATGDYSAGNGGAFDFDDGELGANQEVVAESGTTGLTQLRDSYDGGGIDLTGTFVTKDGDTPFDQDAGGNRWTDADPDDDTVGTSDFLPGALPLQEEPDYSGNVFITSESGGFTTGNADFFADLGIYCATEFAGTCYDSQNMNDSWKQSEGDVFVDLDIGSGVTLDQDPTALLAELADWAEFINSLEAEYVITNELLQNCNYAEDSTDPDKCSAPWVTDLDAIDSLSNNVVGSDDGLGNLLGTGNNDGFAVIDIKVDGDFEVTNSDWILSTLNDTIAIFRISSETDENLNFIYTSNIKFSNSSIMMGPGCLDGDENPTTADTCNDDPITELGAIFFSDHSAGNEVFNLSNVILGGIALWDLDQNDGTIINLNNVQGCAQFVGSQVVMSSKERFNRCSLSVAGDVVPIPTPPTAWLLLAGLAAVVGLRSRRRSADRTSGAWSIGLNRRTGTQFNSLTGRHRRSPDQFGEGLNTP